MLGLTVLAGCENGVEMPFGKAADKSAGEAAASTSTRLVERDVEAPEVFQVTEAGLWDGRPSLGGVWVAHPDVKEPERVIIRNTANGKFVIGALFRREREIPGPRIQVSSDAAAALGMLAGAPVRLNVTALRREKVEETPPEPETKPPAEAKPAPGKPEPKPKPRPEPEPKAEAEAAPAAPAAEGGEAAAAAPKKRGGFFGLFAGGGKKRAKADEAAAISEEPLDPIAGAAAAALDATAPGGGETAKAKAKAKDGAASAPAPAKPPAPARKPSTLAKPYIQIGIFSIEDNAMRAAGLMRNVGIIPTVYEQKSRGKAFWRVVVGPARTVSERSALMKQVRKAGFSDAYYVTN